jgi:hypothetical protein
MGQFLGGRPRHRFSNSPTELGAPSFAFFLAKGGIARTLPAVFPRRPDKGCTRKRPLSSHHLHLLHHLLFLSQQITLPRLKIVPERLSQPVQAEADASKTGLTARA